MKQTLLHYLILFLLSSFPWEVQGKIIHVAWDATGAQTGETWQNSFIHISNALSIAQDGDEIWVKKGTYRESASITLNKNVALYGGFVGMEAAREERSVAANETILDGKGQSFSVVLMTMGRLDGFTIRGGKGTLRQYKDVKIRFGGCILVDFNSTNPVVAQCKISETETPLMGYAFACLYAQNLTMEDCILENNKAPAGEGAMMVGNGAKVTMRRCIVRNNDDIGLLCDYKNQITIEDSQFTSNTLGGVWFMGSEVEVKRCAMRNNSCRGINFMYGSSGIVTDCEITNNNTDAAGNTANLYMGGGILIDESSPTLYNCLIKKNRVTIAGGDTDHFAGGVWIGGGSPVFIRCRIEENNAYLDHYSYGGGGIYLAGKSEAKFINTMFINNEGKYGGGAFIESGPSPFFYGCIFTGNKTYLPNTQSIRANGDVNITLYNTISLENQHKSKAFTLYIRVIDEPYTYANYYIRNCALWDESPEFYIASDGSQAFVDYSCVVGGWQGEGNIAADPLFIDAGLSTKTASGEWTFREGYYMLQSKALGFPKDSPCIDAGDPDAAQNDAALPPGQGGARCDMGAFGGPYNAGWKFYLVGPLVNYLLGRFPGYPFDANNDGYVNVADIVECIRYIPPMPSNPPEKGGKWQRLTNYRQ